MRLDDLLDELGVSGEIERHCVTEILRSLAAHLDVDAGVLRASDTFDRDLRLAKSWIGFPDVTLDAFSRDVRDILARFGVDHWPPFPPRGESLLDFSQAVVGLLRGGKTNRPESFATRSDEPR